MPLSRFDNGKRVAGMSDGLPVDVALEDRDVYAFLHMGSPFVGIKKDTDESVSCLITNYCNSFNKYL